jgi:glycosyltransferase involved in cell wall biosynthesis
MVNWRDPWQDAAGGAEEYAWQMSRGLGARGARMHFVTSREPGQSRREEHDGIRLVRMGGVYSRYPLVLGWLLAHRGRFDVVIDCMNGIPFLSPLAVSRRTRVILLVHHVHGRQFFVYLRGAMAAIGKAFEGPIARRVYRRHPAVAVSPSTATAMRDQLHWGGPIFVVPNGTPALRPVNPAHADGDPAIIVVGRLVTHKRIERVIDAADRLRQRWPGLILHIVGRGPEHDMLKARIAQSGLQGTVRLHGYLPESEKNALLAGARLHISASEFEGWGLSVIEAASLGVPTVAPNVDGLREAVRDGETGWLATVGEDLADTIERALKEISEPERRAEVRAACTRWAAAFSWDGSAERMARLIRSEPVTGGGDAYVADYREGPAARSVIVENTDPVRLRALLSGPGREILDIRPATRTELLTGRPGTGP